MNGSPYGGTGIGIPYFMHPLRLSILFAAVSAVITFVIFAPSAQAVSGTCSYHGGVNCGAMADLDGSAICNDGWRDSSETYASVQMCANIHHSCTASERQIINTKYDTDGQWNTIQTLTNQMMALSASSQSRDNAIAVIQASAKIQGLQGQLWLSTNQADAECYALGDARYAASQAEVYTKQYDVKPTITPPAVDKCVAGGIAHSHENGTSCVCDDGFNQYGGQCYNIVSFCPLVLGVGGEAYDATHCICIKGYTYDAENKSCNLNLPTQSQAEADAAVSVVAE